MDEEIKSSGSRKVLMTICVVVALIALIAGAVVLTAVKLNATVPKSTEPVLVSEQSDYLQYEIRNMSLLLTYNITLTNPSDKPCENFRIKGSFLKDYQSGLILEKDAYAKERITDNKVFSLAAGETKTFTLIFDASYYTNSNKPSKELPSITLETAEDEIEVKVSQETENY